jgi:hypothetical protein
VQGKARTQSQKAPVALGNKTFQSKPRVRNISDDRIQVSHSEYVGDITGSSAAFAVAGSYPLNPGLALTFPWLNQIAARYESYKFKKLNFRFMTERPTTESGYVALVPDYDPTDPAPASKSNAFQYESTCKAAPWENLVQVNHAKNLAKHKSFYVRQGLLSASENLAFYDTGNLFVCVGGNSGSVTLGELWCDYVVEFETPQIESNLTGSFDSFKVTSVTAQTPVLPLGTGPTILSSRNEMLSYDNATGRLTFLQAFQGLAVLIVDGTGLSAMDVTSSNVAYSPLGINGIATRFTGAFRFTANAGQYFDVVMTGTTVTATDLRIGPYANSLLA